MFSYNRILYLLFCSDDIISTIESQNINISDHKLLKVYSNMILEPFKTLTIRTSLQSLEFSRTNDQQLNYN